MAIEDVVALKSRPGQWPSLDRQGVSMDTPCKVPEWTLADTEVKTHQVPKCALLVGWWVD